MLRGLDRLNETSAVLQRQRLADPMGGVWEAADIQWWWRRRRVTDDLALPVWFDDVGPVAAVGLTAWDRSWQGDVFVVPGTVDVRDVWSALLQASDAHGAAPLDVVVREDDPILVSLARATGFGATDECSGITWMSAEERPAVGDLPKGLAIVDRANRVNQAHPMASRNGEHIEARLRQCSLYDAALDLSVETPDGTVAGYALFWLDSNTGVGLLEPMRILDAYQRRGFARLLLAAGLDRLAERGATRMKVGFDSEAGRSLYLTAGFAQTATLRTWRR